MFQLGLFGLLVYWMFITMFQFLAVVHYELILFPLREHSMEDALLTYCES